MLGHYYVTLECNLTAYCGTAGTHLSSYTHLGHFCYVLMMGQVQALAHYDDVRLKSEKTGIYIVTYQLPRAPDHGKCALNLLSFF